MFKTIDNNNIYLIRFILLLIRLVELGIYVDSLSYTFSDYIDFVRIIIMR